MMLNNVSGFSPYESMYKNMPVYAAPVNDADNKVPYVDTAKQSANPDEVKKPGRRSSPEECETCENRKYQDGSDEGNVSFKSASHISPESAGARVRAHEGEHVSNAYKKAAQKNGEVVNASVTLKTSICPECGRTYVSGGETNTTIKYENEENPYMKNRKQLDAVNMRGANIDYVA